MESPAPSSFPMPARKDPFVVGAWILAALDLLAWIVGFAACSSSGYEESELTLEAYDFVMLFHERFLAVASGVALMVVGVLAWRSPRYRRELAIRHAATAVGLGILAVVGLFAWLVVVWCNI